MYAHERHQNLTEEKKEAENENMLVNDKNLSETEKQRAVGYKKRYEMQKNKKLL